MSLLKNILKGILCLFGLIFMIGLLGLFILDMYYDYKQNNFCVSHYYGVSKNYNKGFVKCCKPNVTITDNDIIEGWVCKTFEYERGK